jgi:hypothetical protein
VVALFIIVLGSVAVTQLLSRNTSVAPPAIVVNLHRLLAQVLEDSVLSVIERDEWLAGPDLHRDGFSGLAPAPSP